LYLKRKSICFIILLLKIYCVSGQDIGLFQQFNGRFDFRFFGNTMNFAENNTTTSSVTTTTSSTNLTLNPSDQIEKAYLFWAGCGDGDFEVNLNTEIIIPERTFSYSRTFNDIEFTYFSAFKDITTFIQNTGNGIYTLSNLDISPYEALHITRKTNFAGWAILIIYKNNTLPINLINVYDGLEGVPDELNITLDVLNVIDSDNSKVGFLAWEGDSGLATEEFTFNDVLLTNSLNPSNNVFNGTNSFTSSNTLYNMDLDVYDIEDIIQVGDTSAEITLTSYQDFVMINTVVIKLNSQLPDATISINSIENECDSKTILVDYTVFNVNASAPLMAGTPISIYINDQILQTFVTIIEIPVEGSYTSQISLTIPSYIVSDYEIKFVVDDIGNGTGIVTELIETNNTYTTTNSLWVSPSFNTLEPLEACNEGFTKGTFDFYDYEESVKTNPNDSVTFHESNEDANNGSNPILNTSSYIANTTPKEIFVRVNNENCFSITSFFLTTKNCPPTVYNYISANNDSHNDTFIIKGLYDIFLDFKLEIYNRWGRLIWTGNQNTQNWDGYVKDGVIDKYAPDGTYYYLLFLNDKDYPKPLIGYLYLVN
jgi:gliding motility-associated-like protein